MYKSGKGTYYVGPKIFELNTGTWVYRLCKIMNQELRVKIND
jgi:hypothetical protein